MRQDVALSAGVMDRSADDATHPDVTLMSRLSRGDAHAMNELVHRFGPGLHRLIARLTAWSADSDDILQEVYLTAWRKAGTYRGTGSLEGWLRRLAVNCCRNHRRARSAFARLLRRFAGRQTRATGDATTHSDDASSRLHTAMAQLASEDRTVLALYYLEDLNGEEVADALDVTVPTMHVRLHRARRRLRELLEESIDE